jgi:hypothetical protein
VVAVAVAQLRAVLAARTQETDQQALSQPGQLLTVVVAVAVTSLPLTLVVLADLDK